VKYLFYRFYRAALFIRKGGDPEQRAWMVFSIAQGINLYSISQIYLYLFHKNEISIPVSFSVVTSLMILFINYILFLYKDKYLVIVDKFSKETQKERVTGIIIAYLYIIATLVLLFFAKHLQFR
jgi:hypothetical protein